MYASSGGASATVTNNTVTTSGAFSFGILLRAVSLATVNSDTVSTSGGYSQGINAASFFGGSVAVYSNSVTTEGIASKGIYTGTTSGSIRIEANNVSTLGAGSEAILANSTSGSVDIDVYGNIYSQDDNAIETHTGYNATIDVYSTATVTGYGRYDGVETQWVIDSTTGTSFSGGTDGSMAIWNDGFIGSWHDGPASYGDAAIIERGPGHISLYNDGTLHGRVDFSAASSSTVENTSNTSWHTTGDSVLSDGEGGGYLDDGSGGGDFLDGVFVNDIVVNEGLFATADAGVETTIDFAAGTDVFANLGSFVAGEPEDAASQTNLDNLEYFYNSGAIFFGANQTGVPTSSDGATDDHIDAGDASFYGGDGSAYGGDGSTFFMDAFVGAGNNADTFTAGALSGQTQIFVNDTNAGGPGAFNSILLVDGISSTTDAFALGNVPRDKIDKGLVSYVLAMSGGDWSLVGLPIEAGAQASQILAGAQELWHQTDHFDQITDLRRALSDGSALPSQGGGFMEDGSLWIRGVISNAERMNSFTFSSNGGSLTHDVSYDQSVQGVQIGADFLNRLGNGSAMTFGVFGGYVNSDQRFTATSSKFRSDINAWQAGAYVSWLDGPGFIDVMFKAEFLDGEFRNPGAAPVMAKLNGTNIGAQLNAGYRVDVTESVFIEPIGTLSYVSTSLDSTSVYGGTLSFDDATSLRGRLGVQFGLDLTSDDTTIRPFAAVSYWHEFEGANVTTLSSGGTSWSITDTLLRAGTSLVSDWNL